MRLFSIAPYNEIRHPLAVKFIKDENSLRTYFCFIRNNGTQLPTTRWQAARDI